MDNSKIKILIIEDDEFLRDFYYELLSNEGYSVDIAADGEAGFEKAYQGGWDLILLDIMLPKKDGLQILRDLQLQPPQFSNGQIVMLTNLGNDAVINQAFALGANGFLIKSAMDPDEVLDEVHNFLKKQGT